MTRLFLRRKTTPPAPALAIAADLLATAASLGLPVAAPVGTTVYVPVLHNPMRIHGNPWVRVVEGCYATMDGALTALADYLVDERHHPNRVGNAPWAVPEFWNRISTADWASGRAVWKRRERDVHNRARDRWVADRTPRQIIETLSGAEHSTWRIDEIRVHP